MESENKFSPEYDTEGLRRRTLIVSAVVVAVLLGILALTGFNPAAYWPREPLPEGLVADLVVVSKDERKLTLFHDRERLRTYRIALGSDPEGHKREQGDGKTPQGSYVLDHRDPDSTHYKSIYLSYPSVQDRISASEREVDPGGPIAIHGVSRRYAWLGRFHSLRDWTTGSIAVSNQEMDEIWRVVPDGTRIVIEP